MKSVFVCGMLLGVLGVSLTTHRGSSGSAFRGQELVSTLAIEVGLDPESLAVAGCDASEAELILSHLSEASEIRAEYSLALTHLEETAAALAAAAEVFSLDPDDQSLRSQYLQAVQSVRGAEERAAVIRARLVEVAFEGLAPQLRTDWDASQTTRSFRLPRAFSFGSGAAAEANDLERCLTAERRAARLGRQLKPELAERLNSVRLDGPVVLAEQRRAAHLALIHGVFDRY
ncbi:MAG: hypothetical protein IT430_20400 [Phycisphaerales bacterium]|nr:hypothetical protein [Phycisphaerales bacterium]